MYPQSSIQKRVEKQKEHANKNLASWFMKKFSKKTQYLRDQDEESAQADRMRRHGHGGPTGSASGSGGHAKPRNLSAVTNHQSNQHNNDLNRPPPQRQRSFLRAQLLEMKRESAETLLSAQQKRMAGEVVDEVPRFGTQLGLDVSDDDAYDYDESEDDDIDSVRSVDEIDDALQEMTPAEFRAIRKEKWQLKQSRLIDAAASDAASEAATTRSDRAHSSSSSRSDRTRSCSSGSNNKENVDVPTALELNRRISRATQMYADALSQIDHALHPDDHPPEQQPLFLGVTKKSTHRPKSEWI
ncbi:hypothetical protein Gpo141_00006309 [Globisporangium polare]